ncbi:Trm112 family protein [Tunturiibacter gelidoferens]|uniref:Trm112 family protein n=1 Tax=Tunturiibacter gelidiferens TaxID=3069689 RepID=UPI00334115D6
MSAQSPPAEDLRYVVCPVCHQKLERVDDVISCKGCRRRYPVVEGIPVLLADRALIQ